MNALANFAARTASVLPPELAHDAAITALRAGFSPRPRARRWALLKTSLAGLALDNPLGLAAGFDKNAVAPDALLASGFGYVECGTVTPFPQTGNPRPRLFRLRAERGVINRMGFNNDGLDAFAARLAARAPNGVVGANVGANKDSADRVDDYLRGLARVWPHASYVTLNISSPNTPGLRTLLERAPLEDMLARVSAARAAAAREHGQKPLFVKVAPDLDERGVRDIVELAIGAGIDGLIVSNTTLDRPASLTSQARTEAGGLSGRPLFAKSTAMLQAFARAAQGRLALIGVGGVEDGATALAKIKAGAAALQLYSALAYEGPGLVGRILDDLSQRLQAEGHPNLTAAIGVDV